MAKPRAHASKGAQGIQPQPERRQTRLSSTQGGGFVRARFDAAQTTRDNERHWAMADGLSADQEARPEVRRTLRRRSRYEILNNSYALGLVQMLANDTIGTGPRLQMLTDDEELNDRLERDFNGWARAVGLAQTLRLMRKARCQDGEAFAVIGTNPRLKSRVKLSVTAIEADRVEGVADIAEDGREIDGIRYDEYGNPVSYRVLKYHPGDSMVVTGADAVEIPARFMIHTFIQTRPGLHRGVPELTAALPLFAQLRRYNLATLSAAEAAADFAAILYTDTPPEGETDELEPLDSIPLQRNMMMTVPAGWKMGQLEAKHPTANHTEFVKIILSEVARCICSTYGSVAGDFSNFSYASGRLDNQIYHKSIIVDRSNWEDEVLNPILDQWLREWSLANNVFFEEEYLPRTWFWDGFMHVDPSKEANGQMMRLQNFTTTLAAECAREGRDYMSVLRQRAKELRLMKELGIIQGESSAGGENQNEEEEEKDAGRQDEE